MKPLEIHNHSTFEMFEQRRSIRKYIKKSVPSEIVINIIKYATLAPSPKNRQPWKFLILKDLYKDDYVNFCFKCLKELESSANRYGSLEISLHAMEEANTLIIVSNPYDNDEDYKTRWERSDLQAIGAVIQSMLLLATDYGLGSLWINDIYFINKELRKWLKMQNEICAVVALGYPAENPFRRPRKNTNEIVEIRED